MLVWPEKEKSAMELYRKGVSPKEIARQLHMSLRDVYKILKKEFGEKEELSNELNAVILFRKGMKPVDAAIKLTIPLQEACEYYIMYKDSFYLGKFGEDYRFIKGYLKELAIICNTMKNAGLKAKDLVAEANMARDVGQLESRHLFLLNDVEVLEERKMRLNSQIDLLEASMAAATNQYSNNNYSTNLQNSNQPNNYQNYYRYY